MQKSSQKRGRRYKGETPSSLLETRLPSRKADTSNRRYGNFTLTRMERSPISGREITISCSIQFERRMAVVVLSRKALTEYQLIFPHLFLCKHVEHQLQSMVHHQV